MEANCQNLQFSNFSPFHTQKMANLEFQLFQFGNLRDFECQKLPFCGKSLLQIAKNNKICDESYQISELNNQNNALERITRFQKRFQTFTEFLTNNFGVFRHFSAILHQNIAKIIFSSKTNVFQGFFRENDVE